MRYVTLLLETASHLGMKPLTVPRCSCHDFLKLGWAQQYCWCGQCFGMAELVEEKAPWTKNNKSLYIYNINSKPDYCIETIWNSNLIKKLIWKSWFNIQSELEFVSSLQCLRDEPGPPPPDVPAAAASTAPDDLAARQPPFRFTMGWLGFEWLCLGKHLTLNGWELLVSIGKEALEASFELRLNQGWQCLLNQGLNFEGPVRAHQGPRWSGANCLIWT